MPAVPPPMAPLAKTPVFRNREVVTADGTVVPAKQVPAIARWTSLKLEIAIERYPFEWAQDREPRLPAVRALAKTVAGAARWTFVHGRLGGSGSAPAAKPSSPGVLDDYAKKLLLQRFNASSPAPYALFRTGGANDVQYEWSLQLSDLGISVYAHDTPANRKKLDALFDHARSSHDGCVTATMRFAYAGFVSTELAGVRYPWGAAATFWNHEQKQLAPAWRGHIGTLWTVVPEAGKKATAFATKQALARLDEHGLSIGTAPPRSATDRNAKVLACAKAFTTLNGALRKIVTTALHDTKQRTALGLTRKR